MKRLLLSLIILSSLTSFCQDNTSVKLLLGREMQVRNIRFTWGILYSPEYSFRRLKVNDASAQFIADRADKNDIPGFGYKTGITVKYYFRRKIFFESGLQFSAPGYNTKPQNLQITSFDSAIPVKVSYKYRYTFIHVPIKLNYLLFRNRRTSVFLNAGLATNFSLSGQTKGNYTYSSGYHEIIKEKIPGIPSYFSLLGGIAFERNLILPGRTPTIWGRGRLFFHHIWRNSFVRVEPVFQTSIFSFKKTPITTHLYAGGINIMAYYRVVRRFTGYRTPGKF